MFGDFAADFGPARLTRTDPESRDRVQNQTESACRLGREGFRSSVPGGGITLNRLPPPLSGCGQQRLQCRVSARTLPQGLSALAEGLGNLLPRQPSRARKRDCFLLGGIKVTTKCSRHLKDFQRVRVCTCPNAIPCFPERLRRFHCHNTERIATGCQHSFTTSEMLVRPNSPSDPFPFAGLGRPLAYWGISAR
jgi:hypothetical protein